MARERRFSGIKDVINHLNAVGSRGLAAIGGKSRAARLTEDEKFVTLQVGKTVFDGAPRNMRTELWMSSLQRKGIGVAASQKYEDMLLSPVGAEAAADIDKDLGRTFPSTRRFAAADGQEELRRVLRAYAAYDPEVGYCQGMNFVAGLLLMYLPERHAFGGLVVLMQDRGLRKYYSTDMSLLQTHLWQLGRLMPSRLCSHLEAIGVLPLLYGASWLMTCFSADFPASFSARVMDVIMADKMDQALLKAAVALLKRCEGKLLQLHDMEDAVHMLKLELPAWEEPLLHDVLTDAFAKPWSSRQTQLLGSLEGAETVAEALARVQRANLAASIDSTLSTDSAAAEEPDGPAAAARTPGSSRAGTPAFTAPPASPSASTAATTGATSGGAGTSSSSSTVPALFPPPPLAVRRPSSAGAASGGLSPVESRPTSRATSQCGAVQGLPGAAAGAGMEPWVGVGGFAAVGSSVQGCISPASTQRHHQQHSHHQQHHHQQHVQHDMIDMSSPRAGVVQRGQEHWDTADHSMHSSLPPAPQQQQPSSQPGRDMWDPFGYEGGGPWQQQPQTCVSQQNDCGQQQEHKSQHGGHILEQQQGHQQAPAAAADDTGQQQLWQQMQDLSFTQICSPKVRQQQQQQRPGMFAGPNPQHGTTTIQQLQAAGGSRHPQHPQLLLQPQPQAQQQPHHDEDEWGDFLSPHAAT